MARLLPDPLHGAFPAEVLRVHRTLKAIPGDDLLAWVALPLPPPVGAEPDAFEAAPIADAADPAAVPVTPPRPDFLVVHDGRAAFVVVVSPATLADLEEQRHGRLFESAGNRPYGATDAVAAAAVIRHFIETALGTWPAPAVHGLVLYPNIKHIPAELAGTAGGPGLTALGRDASTPEALGEFLRHPAAGDLKIDQLVRLRSHFCPETVVPPTFAARRRPGAGLAAGLTPMLLDYDQESWTKSGLRLPEGAEAVAEAQAAFGDASLVTGVAGSGKSLVLLFRACTQARLAPETRSLVLTHNKALRRELELRFGQLGRPPNVTWHTFYSWAGNHLAEACAPGAPLRIVQYEERDQLIAEAARLARARVTGQAIEFWRDEIDWIQDHDLSTEDAYLAAPRAGRGGPLNAGQRREVLAVYHHYLQLLLRANAEDWSGRALRLWRGIDAGVIRPATYDFVYVDEAQFFAPVWLRALRHAIAPGTGRILLAADPTQGFLKRRQSWLACGYDLRGRSTRLRNSHRNTRPILEFAAAFYRVRLQEEGDDEDLNLPTDAELATAAAGDVPVVIPLAARQDELARVVNEVAAALEGGARAGDILVLVTGGQRTTPVCEALAQRIGADRVVDAREADAGGERVRVCGLDGATGLEAPTVFLLGTAALIERERDLQLTAEQKTELRRDNTRRLYMAFTRAGLKLVITWVGPVPRLWREFVAPAADSV